MLKIVQVGASKFANFTHGPTLKRFADAHPGEIDLAAICVRQDVERAQAFCRSHGFGRVYTDIDTMVSEEKPDACWVITAKEITRMVAGKLMELGVPVLFEKPPGRDLAEAEELAEVSRKSGELVDSEGWSAEEGIPNAGFYQESAAFIDAIHKGVSPRPTAEDAVESVSLAEAVEEGKDWHCDGV